MKSRPTLAKRTESIEKIFYVATAFKVLADPTRLKILCLLFNSREGLCVNEISDNVGISHSAASHQLGRLESRGILRSFREGQMICYAILKNKLTDNLERVIKIFQCL